MSELYDGYQSDVIAELRRSLGTTSIQAGKTYVTTQGNSYERFMNIDYPRDSLQTISDALHEHTFYKLRIYNDPQYSGELMAPKWRGKVRENPIYGIQSFKVDLSQSEDQLWRGMHKSHRNAIRLAEKAGCMFLPIDRFNEAAFQKFYAMYANLGQVKNFKTVKDEGLHGIYKSGLGQIYFVGHQYVVPHLATAFILHSPGKVSRFQFGAGPKEFYKYHPSNLLHWKIILDCKAKGQLWYDMGGASNDNIFKRHFGGKLCPQEDLTWDSTMGKWFT